MVLIVCCLVLLVASFISFLQSLRWLGLALIVWGAADLAALRRRLPEGFLTMTAEEARQAVCRHAVKERRESNGATIESIERRLLFGLFTLVDLGDVLSSRGVEKTEI